MRRAAMMGEREMHWGGPVIGKWVHLALELEFPMGVPGFFYFLWDVSPFLVLSPCSQEVPS